MAAGDAVVKGTNGFTQQPSRNRYVAGRGWYEVQTWMGPNNDTLRTAKENDLIAAGAEEVESDEGWPTIITALFPSNAVDYASISSDSDETAEWSLEPFDLQKDLSTHGTFHGSAAAATALAAIDAEIKRGNGYDRDWTAEYPSLGSGTNALTYYGKLRSMGVDSYLTHGFVLRAVETWDRGALYENGQRWLKSIQAGAVISWASIGVPSSAKISQPWVLIYVSPIWGSPYSGSGWQRVPVGEWLAKPPAIRWARQGKVQKRQVVWEYVGAVGYSSTLYDGGSAVP